MEKIPEKITKVRIPDEAMPDWIKTLHEAGFSDEEMDYVFRHLNKEYFKLKGGKVIEQELKAMEDYFKKEYGRVLTPEQKEYFRKNIEDRFNR